MGSGAGKSHARKRASDERSARRDERAQHDADSRTAAGGACAGAIVRAPHWHCRHHHAGSRSDVRVVQEWAGVYTTS